MRGQIAAQLTRMCTAPWRRSVSSARRSQSAGLPTSAAIESALFESALWPASRIRAA